MNKLEQLGIKFPFQVGIFTVLLLIATMIAIAVIEYNIELDLLNV